MLSRIIRYTPTSSLRLQVSMPSLVTLVPLTETTSTAGGFVALCLAAT